MPGTSPEREREETLSLVWPDYVRAEYLETGLRWLTGRRRPRSFPSGTARS